MNAEKRARLLWTVFRRPRYRLITNPIRKVLRRTNDRIIQHEVNRMRNELMLDTFRVIRLIGWTDQYDEDYYYIIQERVPGVGNTISLFSCVGGFTRLRRRLSPYDYWQTAYLWDLNGATVEAARQYCEEQGIIIK